MSDLTLKFVLQALDKGASTTVRSFTARVHGLSKEVRAAPAGWIQTKAAIDKTTRSAEHFSRAGDATVKELANMAAAQRRFRHEAASTETSWGRLLRVLGRKPDQTIRGGGGGGWLSMLANSGVASRIGAAAGGLAVTGGTLAVAGGAATVGGLALIGKAAIKTGAEFESYRATLKALGGDDAKAKKSLGWIEGFSRTATFGVDDLTSAYIRLKNSGVDPTSGSLRILGDAAIANKKDVMGAVEALLDAGGGQLQQLSDYGITATKVGKRIVYSWDQDGKKMKASSSQAADDIRKSVLGIFDGRWRGAMADQTRTWNGMTNTLGKVWTGFLMKVADGGAFDTAKGHLANLLAFLDKADKDGRLDKWAKGISQSLSDLINTLARMGKEVDWVGMVKSLGTVAHTFEVLAGAVGKVAGAYERLNKALGPLGWVDGPKGPQPGDLRDLFKPGPARPLPAPTWFDRLMTSTDNPAAAAWPKRSSLQTAPARPTIRDFRAGSGLAPNPVVAPAARLQGELRIGLAPGLVLQSATAPGSDIAFRRGMTGDRP